MPIRVPEEMIDVVIAEAIGEGDIGMAQVAQVMFNRADSRGQTLKQVVTAPNQFEGYDSPGRGVKQSMNNQEIREHVKTLINKVYDGQIAVPYPDADHFHTKDISPKWSRSGKLTNTGDLGNHKFYSSPRSRRVAAQRDIPAPTPPTKTAAVRDQTEGQRTSASAYAPQPTAPTSPALQAIEDAAPGVSRSPFTSSGRENIEQSRESAKLSYNMAGKRNLTPSQHLENEILDAVTDVYGPGYEVSVISGAQQKGKSRGEVGTRRHGTFKAADVFVYDSNGNRVKGDDLVPLAQHWLADGKGSIGFPAKPGQSMHMDLIGGEGEGAIPLKTSGPKPEGKLWYYGSPSTAQRNALTAARDNRVGPKVMAKNAPTPPEAGAAERARLREVSNLNSREDSDAASIARTGKPRERSSNVGDPEIMAQFQKQKPTSSMQASAGNQNVMKQFKPDKPTVSGPMTGGANVPINARGRKRDEMEDPLMAGIGDEGIIPPERTQVASIDPDQITAPAQPEPVKPHSPNLLEQFGEHVQGRVGDAIDTTKARVADVTQGVGDFIDDPVNQSKLRAAQVYGTVLNRVGEMGDNVRNRLQPVADFLEGPEYEVVTPNDGWREHGSNVVAVGPTGTKRVNLDYSDSDRRRDQKHHGHMDMSGYRANKAIFDKHGLAMTASNARKLQEMGETLYVPKESESKYSNSRKSSPSTGPTPRKERQRRRTSNEREEPKKSAMDRAREKERERRAEQRRERRRRGERVSI